MHTCIYKIQTEKYSIGKAGTTGQGKNLYNDFREVRSQSVLHSEHSQWRQVPTEPDFIRQNDSLEVSKTLQ